METEQRKFRADPLKLKRLRVAAGLTVKEVREQADLDRTTVSKILRGDAVFLKSLSQLGEKVFFVDNPLELLHPEELHAMGAQTDVPSPGNILEWEIENYLTAWEKTTNGLQYQLAKLRHRFLPSRSARGKCYELRHLEGKEKERVQSYLLRHVEVCEHIGLHPNIAVNITAAPVDGVWWVIDQWEDGDLLSERLKKEPLGDYALKVVMTGIAEGLQELHRNEVVRRELTPQSVLLREKDDRPILTDMELAKLNAGAPTVSPTEWPDDPYRALEVEGDTPVDARADVYSWGRIFVHAATGGLPERGSEENHKLDVPQRVQEVVNASVSLMRSERLDDMKPILKALKDWP